MNSGWGQMMALQADRIVDVPLADVAGRTRQLDLSLFDDVAEVFFA